jgi:crotonobetainyl-CoA:carnitine CoA-transferase CaiB-like acyl-CoA transferase
MDRPAWLVRPAPTLGQHNEEVLGGELGLTSDQLTALAERRVIGTQP